MQFLFHLQIAKIFLDTRSKGEIERRVFLDWSIILCQIIYAFLSLTPTSLYLCSLSSALLNWHLIGLGLISLTSEALSTGDFFRLACNVSSALPLYRSLGFSSSSPFCTMCQPNWRPRKSIRYTLSKGVYIITDTYYNKYYIMVISYTTYFYP